MQIVGPQVLRFRIFLASKGIRIEFSAHDWHLTLSHEPGNRYLGKDICISVSKFVPKCRRLHFEHLCVDCSAPSNAHARYLQQYLTACPDSMQTKETLDCEWTVCGYFRVSLILKLDPNMRLLLWVSIFVLRLPPEDIHCVVFSWYIGL
jgi:hypothetical protein